MSRRRALLLLLLPCAAVLWFGTGMLRTSVPKRERRSGWTAPSPAPGGDKAPAITLDRTPTTPTPRARVGKPRPRGPGAPVRLVSDWKPKRDPAARSELEDHDRIAKSREQLREESRAIKEQQLRRKKLEELERERARDRDRGRPGDGRAENDDPGRAPDPRALALARMRRKLLDRPRSSPEESSADLILTVATDGGRRGQEAEIRLLAEPKSGDTVPGRLEVTVGCDPTLIPLEVLAGPAGASARRHLRYTLIEPGRIRIEFRSPRALKAGHLASLRLRVGGAAPLRSPVYTAGFQAPGEPGLRIVGKGAEFLAQ